MTYTVIVRDTFSELSTESDISTIQSAAKRARRILSDLNALYGWGGDSGRWTAVIYDGKRAVKAYKLRSYDVEQVSCISF